MDLLLISLNKEIAMPSLPVSMRPMMLLSPEIKPLLPKTSLSSSSTVVAISISHEVKTPTFKNRAFKFIRPVAVITGSLSAIGLGGSLLCLFSGNHQIIDDAEIAGSVFFAIGVISASILCACKSRR